MHLNPLKAPRRMSVVRKLVNCFIIVEALAPLEPEVRPMFSGFAVYVGEKIVLMLRDSPKQPEDNGVWLVFSEAAGMAGHIRAACSAQLGNGRWIRKAGD